MRRNHNRWIMYTKNKYLGKIKEKMFDQVDDEENILIEETIKNGGTFTLEEINGMGDRFKEKLIHKLLEIDKEVREHMDQAMVLVHDE